MHSGFRMTSDYIRCLTVHKSNKNHIMTNFKVLCYNHYFFCNQEY